MAPGGGAGGGGGACSGCEHVSPCLDQGLCLDPTVLNLPGDEDNNNNTNNAPRGDLTAGGASSQGTSGPPRAAASRQAFLIEGQLVVASPDGGWMPVALSTLGGGGGGNGGNGIYGVSSSSGNGQGAPGSSTPPGWGTPLSGAEVATLGLPASPEEARAYLVRINADTVPHGDHVDFVVGNRLIHIVTAGAEASGHCGSDCGAAPGSHLHHAAGGAMMVDHGQLDITRRRVGGDAQAQAAASSSSSSASGAPAARAAHTGIGGGRYLPHVQPSSKTMESSASASSASSPSSSSRRGSSVAAAAAATVVFRSGSGFASASHQRRYLSLSSSSSSSPLTSTSTRAPLLRSAASRRSRGPNGEEEDKSLTVELRLRQPDDIEMGLGRCAMLGFLGCTLGDVLTRGLGPLEQLRDEEMYVLSHVNPLVILQDTLQLAGFYVEGVLFFSVCLALVFLAAMQQGLSRRKYGSRDKVAEAKGAQRVDVMVDSVREAVSGVVRDQKPYELINGRLAMLGITCAFIGDMYIGGGPLEQLNLETGVPVIDEEMIVALFLTGVMFNIGATVVTTGQRAWDKGKSI